MTRWYILENGVPVERSAIVASLWRANHFNEVRLRYDEGADWHVSTVFLCLDHGWHGGDPVLWETMVFGGTLDGECERYTSREAAIEGHERILARLRIPSL